MNKVDLEVKIESLKNMITEGQQETSNYAGQLNTLNKELEDLGKPEVTPEFLDKISETITKAVEELEFDAEDIELNLEMDYDNKVNIDTAELKDPSGIADKIYCAVELLFACSDDPVDRPED